MPTRRQFLAASAAAVAAGASPAARVLAADDAKGYALPALPYATDALEKAIDKQTMEIHHGRHHKTYVDNLNKALAGTDLLGTPVEKLLADLNAVPEKARSAVRNNGGGHLNHTAFWAIMTPQTSAPAGELAEALTSTFGRLDGFKKALTEKALGQFGSGWAWLVVKDGKLAVTSTPNQDNPVMQGHAAILGVDVWEHAYYLRYQNKRKDYVEAWFNVLNWEEAGKRFTAAKG